MKILTKNIFAVKPGEVYPKNYLEGTECPSELYEIAASLDALGEFKNPSLEKAAHSGAPETKVIKRSRNKKVTE